MTVIFGKGGFRNFSFSPGYIHFLIFLYCLKIKGDFMYLRLIFFF